jgi:hypothetical protein
MNAIKMDRVNLLKIVQENMSKHVEQYKESVEDYKALALKLTADNLKLAKTGELDKIAQIKSLPSKPVSYEDSYKRAARMLELSVDDIIEVEEDVFNQLVLDEWSWKRGFVAAGTAYKMGYQ